MEIGEFAREHVAAIKNVSQTIAQNNYDNRAQPWPGMVYFEDVSSEAQFDLIDLIEIIVQSALEKRCAAGARLERRYNRDFA